MTQNGSTDSTHSFLFGALAELLDNARDAGAVRLDVFSVDNEKVQGGFMLCFLDDGCGMGPEEAVDIIYFGTSKKRSSTFKLIGQYGNGLKSGGMRIGKDFILFTKKEETMTCLLFSQTFCEEEGLTEVVVPIPSWLTKTREPFTNHPQKFSTELSIIYKYSPFKSEAELMHQFNMIYGKCGTLLVVYNLKLLLNGEPELDVRTDRKDILIAGATEESPERQSFRAYTAILYFEPRMKIFIQAERVQTKHLSYSLFKPRKYQHITYFKGKFKNEITKAEEAVKTAEDILKEARMKAKQPDRDSLSSAKDVLKKALEDVEAKRKTLQEKQKEFRKIRTLSLIFGVNIENRNQAGMFIYSNNRLIKMYRKVGPQLKVKSLLGAGVIGIVNIPLALMEPSHNKQEFINVQEYNHVLRLMGQYLIQYCKDTGISNRNLALFWDDIRHQQSKDKQQDLQSIQYQRRQAMGIPLIIQCDLCLKWRVLPYPSNYQERQSFDMWICANNPNCLENSCTQVECLPSIPLGTIAKVSSSKNEKDKQLQEVVERYQNRLMDQPPQGHCKIQRIGSPGDDVTKRPRSSFELPTSHDIQGRSTSDADSDVEFVAVTQTMNRPRPWNNKQKQQGHKETLLGNLTLTQTDQVSTLEMKMQESTSLLLESKMSTQVENKSSDPDIILISSKSSPDGSLRQELEDSPKTKDPMNDDSVAAGSCEQSPGNIWTLLSFEDEQELRSDNPVMKNSAEELTQESLPNVEMEDLSPSPKHKAGSVNGSGQVPSSVTSQSTSTTETARKLLSILREIFQHFDPEFQTLTELGCTDVKDLLVSLKMEGCPEKTNEKLRTCMKQIRTIYMVQYEKKMKAKLQAISSETNRKGILNEVFLGQCEQKRKMTEDRLNDLQTKATALLQEFGLDHPLVELEQTNAFLESLLLK